MCPVSAKICRCTHLQRSRRPLVDGFLLLLLLLFFFCFFYLGMESDVLSGYSGIEYDVLSGAPSLVATVPTVPAHAVSSETASNQPASQPGQKKCETPDTPGQLAHLTIVAQQPSPQTPVADLLISPTPYPLPLFLCVFCAPRAASAIFLPRHAHPEVPIHFNAISAASCPPGAP